MNPTCRSCRWYDAPPVLADIGTPGTCHANPPAVTAVLVPVQTAHGMGAQLQPVTSWPNVHTVDWCGRHTVELEKMQ